MAISSSAQSSLDELRGYYGRLSKFYRWFLPTNLRNALDKFEQSSINDGPRYYEVVNSLCAALSDLSRFSQWIIGFFYGILIFKNSDFFKAFVRCHAITKSVYPYIEILMTSETYSLDESVNSIQVHNALYSDLEYTANKESINAISELYRCESFKQISKDQQDRCIKLIVEKINLVVNKKSVAMAEVLVELVDKSILYGCLDGLENALDPLLMARKWLNFYNETIAVPYGSYDVDNSWVCFKQAFGLERDGQYLFLLLQMDVLNQDNRFFFFQKYRKCCASNQQDYLVRQLNAMYISDPRVLAAIVEQLMHCVDKPNFHDYMSFFNLLMNTTILYDGESINQTLLDQIFAYEGISALYQLLRSIPLSRYTAADIQQIIKPKTPVSTLLPDEKTAEMSGANEFTPQSISEASSNSLLFFSSKEPEEQNSDSSSENSNTVNEDSSFEIEPATIWGWCIN